MQYLVNMLKTLGARFLRMCTTVLEKTFLSNILFILKDYCLHSSLAGLKFIADDKWHPAVRIFWLICVMVSSLISYRMIVDYQENFEAQAIGIVIEDISPFEVTDFPSIAVCEMGGDRESYPELMEIAMNLTNNTDTPEFVRNDIVGFLRRIVFINSYSKGSIIINCDEDDEDEECMPHPKSGFREIAEKTQASCTEMLLECQWNDIKFNCCKYFLPIKTSMGLCYMINSIQLTEKNSENWFPMKVEHGTGFPRLQLRLAELSTIVALNEEDIPLLMITRLQYRQYHHRDSIIRLRLLPMINDEGVRNIRPEIRRCLFPDEQSNLTYYKYYSYSVCVTLCLRFAQLKKCNCTHHYLIFGTDDEHLSCDYEGLLCLDREQLFYPLTNMLQPWRANRLPCECLPSCSENEMTNVGSSWEVLDKFDKPHQRLTEIRLQSIPFERYRRQAVRGTLDWIVSIGGILGLFTGASILSAVELAYFFTIRICGNLYLRWQERASRTHSPNESVSKKQSKRRILKSQKPITQKINPFYGRFD